MAIELKNLILLENQMMLEALAAKKSELYAEAFQDAAIKAFAQQLANHHKDNFASLLTYLSEQQ